MCQETCTSFLLPLLAAKRFTTSLPTYNLIFCANVAVIRNSRAADADATKCDDTVEFRRVELCKLNRRQSAERSPTVADCRRLIIHIYTDDARKLDCLVVAASGMRIRH